MAAVVNLLEGPVDADADVGHGAASGGAAPVSRDWAAARKRSKDTVLKWDFATLLEAEVCNETGFQARLKKAYMIARSVFTMPAEAKGEACVTLTPDAVEKKLPGPVSWLLMFSSVMMLLLIDSIVKSPSKATVVLSNYSYSLICSTLMR